jgi:CRISPR-associated protein Cmr2
MSAWRFRLDADYWDHKLSNYLHDPPDKALAIPGHEARSRLLTEVLGPLPSPDPEAYRRADAIAAGMDRSQLPPYHADPQQSGAIDFTHHPILTHPTGAEGHLRVILPSGIEAKSVNQAVVEVVQEDLAALTEAQGLKGNPAALAAVRFHYIHHWLRERLARRNVGGLGGLWHRLPADTRQPDHSIWQHCGLVAALTSCFALSEQKKASLLVFSLTPVQDFIIRARKLRDFWSGSLILSWLAFEGLRTVIYELGSDHVLYPSLINQPLVNWLLAHECHFDHPPDGWWEPRKKTGVASLPNKFVCLVPAGQEKNLADRIQQGIQQAWGDLGKETLRLIEKQLDSRDEYLSEVMHRQMAHYWEYHWSACPLLNEATENAGEQLLPESVWNRPITLKEKIKHHSMPFRAEGAFYPLTHALSQSYLAAGKTRRTDRRPSEKGIKCGFHGDMEILRFSWKREADRNPRPAQDPFWSEFKRRWQPASDFKPSERLSAVALVKRLAYGVCQQSVGHPLRPFFQGGETFPSTTEMALADWFQQVENTGFLQEFREVAPDRWRRILAQVVHEQDADTPRPEKEPEIHPIRPEERHAARALLSRLQQAGVPVRDEDKYYAILLMDGDRMGKLVNGETLASRWETVLHPSLVERLRHPGFPPQYRNFWEQELAEPRSLAPAVHAAISEALGDFSLYTVPAIINRHRGRLIYAGGDDICALLPASEALTAAREIAGWYNRNFIFIPETTEGDELPQSLTDTWSCDPGRLAVHLGRGKDISISAGLLLVHHKRPLTGALHRVHELLKNVAKERGGRNALALELEKRAGGSRLFVTRWQEEPWPALALNLLTEKRELLTILVELAATLGRPPYRELSASLVYRLEELQAGLEAMAALTPSEITSFIKAQVQRSQKEEPQAARLADLISALIIRTHAGSPPFKVDIAPLLIARFLGALLSRQATKEVNDA